MSGYDGSEPLSGVFAPRTAKPLERLGLLTVGDLLRHFPRRYETYGELTPIAQLPLGHVSLVADVITAEFIRGTSPGAARPGVRRRPDMLKVVVTDGTDRLDMMFFNAGYIRGKIRPGARMLFSGTLGEYKGHRRLTHPKWQELAAGESAQEVADRPVPVYPASKDLTQKAIRSAVATVLDHLGDTPDPIPAALRARRDFPPIVPAFEAAHRPGTPEEGRKALARFRFEEAFVLQAALARRRRDAVRAAATPRRDRDDGLRAAFDDRLRFTLTAGQRAVGEQLGAELAGEHPMHRLLQGEVGSGKTVVAVRAMLTVVDSGGQAALLAPTEVLAAQHHRSITELLGELAEGDLLSGGRGTRVVLLTGSMSTAARREALLHAASGEAGIVIGTHALLQEQVSFADLGLVVVDEQHRFGVEQRDLLRGKARTAPHLLVMTATPIPRTVAMTVFGDLEVSTLAELPAGRPEITTHVVALAEQPQWYDRVWRRVREEVDRGHQVFVVCPRIGDDAATDSAGPDDDGLLFALAGEAGEAEEDTRPPIGVLETVEELRGRPELAGLRIETLHGRMPADERESVMRGVTTGAVHVLVATTVIEVGVDVPNATVMVVLDADRFGISQLHQLRGRVGRGSAPGLCLLVTRAAPGTPQRGRLNAVAATTDGFELARADLDQRREGDVLGAAQHGATSLRLLRVLRDEKLIAEARQEAADLVAADPDLTGHPDLARAIEDLLGPDREAYLDRG